MSSQGQVRLRRVGFRGGTDEELTALHEVETPIAAERGSYRMPQPLESYISYARNLPSQFNDHAWLVETTQGAPIACGFCWSNSAGDQRMMECDVLVRRDRRRQGIGSQLLRAICEASIDEGRSLLTWSTFDAVPAGGAFSHRLGARVARVNRTSELEMADVDWTVIETWIRTAMARNVGYRLEVVDGVFPEHLRADAAVFHHIMQTAPREDLDAGDVMIDADFVAELDRALVESGRARWSIFVRDPTGRCIGGTEVIFEPGDSGTVFQQNTGIDSGHRGLGLAKWVKAAMLQRMQYAQPAPLRVRTGNASSNAAMLAINEALGFKLVNARTEWQADAVDLVKALC